MSKKLTILSLITLLVVVSGLFGFYLFQENRALAGTFTTYEIPGFKPDNMSTLYTFLSATTTTGNSTGITPAFDASGRYDDGSLGIAGASKVTLYFQRGDTTGQGNTGKSVFDIDVTPDGTNWYDFNKLIGNDISSTATTTVTISAATSTVVYSMDLSKETYKAIRCNVTETTDGEHTCKGYVEY